MALVDQLPLALDDVFGSLVPTAARISSESNLTVTIGGRTLRTTAVFDSYWRFAARRQAIYEARVAGRPGPWTSDQILSHHRFTNCFRAADRVSQFLIRNVAYAGKQSPDEIVFRVLLFKLFNKISTWQLLEHELGELTWADFIEDAYDAILSAAFARGERLYSAAYVIPPPRLGADRKHTNHLRLLRLMMEAGVTDQLRSSATMSGGFETLLSYPALGDFLAYQFLIDLNYSTALDFDEMEFVVAGPGARDGIRKCFGPHASGIEPEIIAYMATHQREHFDRLGLTFNGLWGRPLQLIDCQNLFCEVDKYARVAHPDIAGISGRSRIKQRFAAALEPVSAWFPPKWGLAVSCAEPPSATEVRCELDSVGENTWCGSEIGVMAAGLETHQEERAALAMAEALERLVAVIDRELNSDASEGVGIVDPAWVDAIATVVRAAESSSAVLDEPDVLRVLTRASSILR